MAPSELNIVSHRIRTQVFSVSRSCNDVTVGHDYDFQVKSIRRVYEARQTYRQSVQTVATRHYNV